ncbi:MAG TPA: efflux RND transporter periplasmic adaptor subunit [Flavipsychrobacter sp.]|nr:efflux RND transporter periplasmic adaptor subunit [Flavipsychrobacter sp.]
MPHLKIIFWTLFIAVFMVGISACEQTTKTTNNQQTQYTCPMHPEIVRDAPGSCPICGMDLVKKETNASKITDITLTTLLQPTDKYVLSTIPVTTAQYRNQPMEIEALGYTAYNTSSVGTIASRTTGRIERLYVKYRYQLIEKGQRIMDIYSPELLTAQENLLFLLKNDPNNQSLISSAKQRLLLLGMSSAQVQNVIATRKASLSISVYSNYSGHIHEAQAGAAMPQDAATNMNEATNQTTRELNLKEGMYVQKGQTLFSVYDPDKLWGVLGIYQSDQPYIKVGDNLRIVPEANPVKDFRATIAYIEPVFRQGSKTITARVNIPNSGYRLPVGSQIRATIFAKAHAGWWLPKESVLSLGMNEIVFVKRGTGFAVKKVVTGHTHTEWIQIMEGLGANDSVALNAQYLMDSESFIKSNNE